MLKLSISFTSQETGGSVSVLKAVLFFCLAAETLGALSQCSEQSTVCFERMVCASEISEKEG